MDWSKISIGLIGLLGGTVGTKLVGLFERWLDHRHEERQERAKDNRLIAAEERVEARRIAEEERAEARKKADREISREEQIKNDEAILLLFKTRLKGCAYLPDAAMVVQGIHAFFEGRPQYFAHDQNTEFLKKYPQNFHSKVCFASADYSEKDLVLLKEQVDSLRLRADA